jgi:DNA-binding FadR family transcriptional regulator
MRGAWELVAARNDYDERSRIMVTEVRAPKTAELVAAHLRRRIVRGELKEGDALPPETVLLGQFGVSRPTLREAFRVLEAELLISVRRGARGGARVHTPNVDVAARYAGLVLEHRGTTLADIYEARNIIEPPCASLLARRRTPEQLRRLWEEVERAEAVIDERNRLIRIHTEFHALIVDFSGNQTMRVLSGMLRHIIDTAHWERLAEDAGSRSERQAIHRDVREHRRVVELIEAGDAEAAEALWRKHLVEAADRLTSGPIATTVLDLLG